MYNRLRLFATIRKEPYRCFFQALGFSPNDISLYQEAFRHRSACNSNEEKSNNERLEFLGDSILDAIVADILFKKYPKKNEGFLSKTRSKIVKRETLNQVAIKMGLDKVVEVAIQSHSHNNYTYGNALEALIGAIYMDQGYDNCFKIVEEHIIAKYINIEKLAHEEANYKSRLIEWCQHYHLPYEFEVNEVSSDEHKNPIFHVLVIIAGRKLSEGRGYSKKEAQQYAARTAYKHIKKQKNYAATLMAGMTSAENNTIANE